MIADISFLEKKNTKTCAYNFGMVADISFLEHSRGRNRKIKNRKEEHKSPIFIFIALAVIVAGVFGSYFSLYAATSTRRVPLVFQGRITDANYVPVADTSSRRMIFRIWSSTDTSAASDGGGTCAWSTGNNDGGATNSTGEGLANCGLAVSASTLTSSAGLVVSVPVTITRGVFSIPLGDTAFDSGNRMPVMSQAFDNQSSEVYYIEIFVQNDSGTYERLSPRVRISSASYAYNADELDGLNSASFMRTDAVNSQSVAIATGDFLNIVPSGSTAITGNIRGIAVDLTTGLNLTNITAFRTVYGVEILTPAYTNNTTNQTQIRGLGINGNSGTVTHGATNSTVTDLWSGIDIYMPNLVEGNGVVESWGLSIRRATALDAGEDTFALFTEINAGNVGFGLTANTLSTTTVPYLLTLGGDSAQTFGMGPRTTSGAAGNNLTVIAGAPISGTNLSGGNLIVSGGGSTGTETSNIIFQTATAGSSGSVANSPSTKMTLLGNGNVGIGDLTPDSLLNIQSDAGANNGIIISQTNAGDLDPFIQFEVVDGTPTFTIGIDDSVTGDPFKISTTALGTNDFFVIDPRTSTTGVTGISIRSPIHATAFTANASDIEYTTFAVTPPSTISFAGVTVTPITSQMDSILFNAPRFSIPTGLTINNATTLTIAGAPIFDASAPRGTLSNVYALKINGETTSENGAAPTNAYGLYVDAPTGATNMYAAAFVTGNVGIGTATPASALQVSAGYIQFPYVSSAPNVADCNVAAEGGRVVVYDNGGGAAQLYVCDGDAGWVTK